jgi:cyclic-di-GMP-binding protein
MFSFLGTHSKDANDPLTSGRNTSVWLKQLPVLDVIGRQQQVMRAFDGLRQSRRPLDLGRVQAIEYLDSALGADRRQLIKQYVENHDAAGKLAERIWQASYDLTQGFLSAYQVALEEALRQDGSSRWGAALPLLFARLLHYYGTDAKLRVFRFERWIPGKWMELHRAYLRCTELGVDRSPAVLGSAGPNATSWTPEQEYLNALLIHQLNTGNLSPSQLDWAGSQLRAWSRKLVLDAVPRSPEGFFVDLAGKAGLVRRNGSDSGSMLRYVDTTPMAESLERAIHALRSAEVTDQGPAAPINQQRIAILEKVRPAIAPNINTELRRDPRVACQVSARVRIGLARICRELASKGANDAPAEGSGEQIEVYAVSDAPRVRRQSLEEHDSLAMSLSSFSDPMWQVKDRSVAGLRIAASGGIGQSLALGGLVAVRQSDVSEWVLGVVRRLNKLSNEDVEAGVSLIAERVVPVILHTKRDPKEDLGFIVNGIDMSTIGARFEGLYLPPPSRPDKPLSVKTLIVPTSEYADGRQVILTTDRSVYTVALKNLVEQRSEWSWTAIQIVEKRMRE